MPAAARYFLILVFFVFCARRAQKTKKIKYRSAEGYQPISDAATVAGYTMSTKMTTTTQLPRSVPEAQGIASSAILGFIQAAEQHIHDLHSLMVLRHGQVVAEGWWAPYVQDDTHKLFSLSKSFTSLSSILKGGNA